MRVWIVEFVPYGTLRSYCFARIEGVYDSYGKAKEKALFEINEDIRCNDFVVNEECYDCFENHNKFHESVHIEVFSDKVDNYDSYYMMSIIPMIVE